MSRIITIEILEEIRKLIHNIENFVVDQIVVGTGYTAASLTSGQAGVCFTFETEITPNMRILHERARQLAGTRAIEVAEMAKSLDLSESVIGMAALNALSSIAIEKDKTSYSLSKGNILEEIDLTKNDTVVMVGNMIPLRKEISQKVKRVYVLEKDPIRRETEVLPDTASEKIVPIADVAIITGTSLANGTLERLLELSRGAREIAVVGASASVFPVPLFRHGVTILGSIRILDTGKLFQIVSEGGGTQQFKKAVEFINMRTRNSVY